MKGISSVLTAIHDRQYISTLPTFRPAVKGTGKQWPENFRPEYTQLVSALDILKNCVQSCLELQKAVRELSVFVENLKRLPLNMTPDQQIMSIYPVSAGTPS